MPNQNIWLTTIDNPFDYFEQFDDWYKFDESKGYCTCSLIARLIKSTEFLTEYEIDEMISNAINEIISFDVNGIYKIVKPSAKAS